MYFLRKLSFLCLLPAAACLLYVGCAPVVAPTTQPVETTQPVDMMARIRLLQTNVSELDATARRLPGGTEQTNRPIVQSCFLQLTHILPLIEGDYQTGEFRSGLRVLNSTQEQLASSSSDLATEPTISQGLRATERVLRSLDNFVFDKDADILAKIDALQQGITALDNVHGATYRAQAAQVIRGVADVCQQMTTAIMDRAGTDGKPTTNPTTNPATNPSTRPVPAP